MMRERDIEKILVGEVKRMGGRAYKWVSPGRIVIFPGRKPVFVELKTETGKLSPLQAAQVAKLKGLGQDVRVLYGHADVRAFLGEHGGKIHGI